METEEIHKKPLLKKTECGQNSDWVLPQYKSTELPLYQSLQYNMKHEGITDLFYLMLCACNQSAYKNHAELISVVDHRVTILFKFGLERQEEE